MTTLARPLLPYCESQTAVSWYNDCFTKAVASTLAYLGHQPLGYYLGQRNAFLYTYQPTFGGYISASFTATHEQREQPCGITRHLSDSLAALKAAMAESLAGDRPLMVYSDPYHLPWHFSKYGIRHSAHIILVAGFDDQSVSVVDPVGPTGTTGHLTWAEFEAAVQLNEASPGERHRWLTTSLSHQLAPVPRELLLDLLHVNSEVMLHSPPLSPEEAPWAWAMDPPPTAVILGMRGLERFVEEIRPLLEEMRGLGTLGMLHTSILELAGQRRWLEQLIGETGGPDALMATVKTCIQHWMVTSNLLLRYSSSPGAETLDRMVCRIRQLPQAEAELFTALQEMVR